MASKLYKDAYGEWRLRLLPARPPRLPAWARVRLAALAARAGARIDRIATWFGVWHPTGAHRQFKIGFAGWFALRARYALGRPWDELVWKRRYESAVRRRSREGLVDRRVDSGSSWGLYGIGLTWRQKLVAMLRVELEQERRGITDETLWAMVEGNLGRKLNVVPSGIEPKSA